MPLPHNGHRSRNIQSIVIASDLCERSDRALQRRFLLAREPGACVTLVSIVDDSAPESLAEELVEKCHAHLEASAANLAGDVGHEVRVEVGDPIPRLVDIVISGGFHLTGVGRHCSRGLFDGVRQTTLESVVSRSRMVLMAVSALIAEYTRVLAPVSFSSACQQAGLCPNDRCSAREPIVHTPANEPTRCRFSVHY